MTRIALLVLAVVSAAIALAPAGARAAAPGINLHGVPQLADVPRMKALGAEHARAFLLWGDVEHARGQYEPGILAAYDEWIDAMDAAGIDVVLGVAGSPQWASGSADRWRPPRRAADYAAFVGAMAKRWRGKVAGYEIWNEPDERGFWRPRPDARRYVRLLRAAHRAIRRGDPKARVVTGPLTAANFAWLERLYRLGARRSFDAVAIHANTACSDRGPRRGYREPDGRQGRFTFLGFREVRRTMVANGDRRKPIWMTEIGWSSTQRRCARGTWAGRKPAGVGPRRQAAYLREAFRCLAAERYVTRATWFTLHDLSPRDGELSRYGLLRADGSRKPAWHAFRAVARGGRRAATRRCAPDYR